MKTTSLSVALTLIYVLVLASCVTTNNKNNAASQEQHKHIDGIDVSHHQNSIHWSNVRESIPDCKFVYIKCTEGTTYRDPDYKRNAKGAREQGFLIGGFHYFKMTSSAHSQFKNYVSALSDISPDLIPMVDVETNDNKPIKELQDSLSVFLNLLERHYGVKPMIYGTNRSYNEFCAPRFNSYPLYIGRYGNKAPVVSGPSQYTIWQYTDKALVDGIEKPVDLCVFNPSKDINDIKL